MYTSCNCLQDQRILLLRKLKIDLIEVQVNLFLVFFEQLIEAREVKGRLPTHLELLMVGHRPEELHEFLSVLKMKAERLKTINYLPDLLCQANLYVFYVRSGRAKHLIHVLNLNLGFI